MPTLKELTQHNHDTAENHPFVKLLLGGNISEQIYASYLANQFLQYQTLETLAADLFKEIPGLARAECILEDLMELDQRVVVFPSTSQYCKRLRTLNQDELLAHVYTKHMGDLYGGQMIKRVVPGSGKMYDFGDNRTEIIKSLREKLTTEMAAEANIAFESTLEMFDGLAYEYDIQ